MQTSFNYTITSSCNNHCVAVLKYASGIYRVVINYSRLEMMVALLNKP